MSHMSHIGRFVLTVCAAALFATQLAAKEPCYVFVQNPGSYESLVVSSIALTMIRQFIDPEVGPAPLSGFSERACTYSINVSEDANGLKVFVFGKNISELGESNLRGEPGLEQAALRAIFKGSDDKSKQEAICLKYGRNLEAECRGKGFAVDKSGVSGSAPTETTMKEYRHSAPFFSIQYPATWTSVDYRGNPNIAFMVAKANQKAPALDVVIRELPRRKTSDKLMEERIISIWEKRIDDANNFQMGKPNRISLDGKAAVLRRFSFYTDKDRRIRLSVAHLLVEDADRMMVFQIWGPASQQQEELVEKIIASIRLQ